MDKKPVPRHLTICSICTEPWLDHLHRCRERLREQEPARFYRVNGIEYPLVNSPFVESSVTAADCKQ